MIMQIFSDVEGLQAFLDAARANGKSVGFVPTMGNLHEGHLALMQEARECSDVVIASVFVNPLQFDRQDDLDKYPRTFERDCELMRDIPVDAVFAPTPDVIYPEGMQVATQVSVPFVTDRLEGAGREGHFEGVATVVTKLLNIVQPDVAIFGEKDFQQLMVVRKLVRDLSIRTKIRAGETVRNTQQLALSSRNSRISDADLPNAPKLYATLQQVAAEVLAGEGDLRDLEQRAISALNEVGFKAEYVELCDALTLLPATLQTEQIVVLAAAWLGDVRLIDNLVIR